MIGGGLRLLPLGLLAAAPLLAQASPAAGITPNDMRRHIEILAADSMMGRATASPGLARAAAYVTGEFRRLGLHPAGTAGYEQRWGLSHWVPDRDASVIRLASRGAAATLRLGGDARFISGTMTGDEVAGDAVLVAGPLTPAVTLDRRLDGRVVLILLDWSRGVPEGLGDRVDEVAARARAVLLLSDRDSAGSSRRLASAAEPRLSPDFQLARAGAPTIEVHERALTSVLSAAGLDLTRLRASPSTVTPAPVWVSLRLRRRVLERSHTANLVARLEGSDPVLRREHVVLSAHLDGLGIRPGAPDSILNGADDNASGVAGLLELAEAFSAEADRPRRSLLFLVPSGEEPGLWGSHYFVEHPTVPLDDIVAAVNMDLIGRNWPDSVIAVGPEFSTLGETLRAVTAAHPGLRMTPLRDRWPEERIFYRSDHYHFARRGVPILFFTSGTHPDYHQPTDSADRIDAEKAARLVRLLYHLTAAIGDDPARPRWSPEQYRAVVGEQ